MMHEMLGADAQDEKVLSVFDFDGTLTRRDSFVPFLRFAFGKLEFIRRIFTLAIPSVHFLFRRMNRDELKAHLIAKFLTGVEVEWIEQKALDFCNRYWTRLMRPSGLLSVAAEIEAGAEVTLCSASPALVLTPFARRLGIKLIATELEVVDGVLTGRISGNNCRCENKVIRLEAVYGLLSEYRLRAWGDTRGDLELLAAAQDAHWRHFHSAWRRGRMRRAKKRKQHASVQKLKSENKTNTDDQQGA
ncbi:HAD family hydrolase [Pseudomonas sp.]|uniref:HAD family hydrolase n=1 Tax=Pseudomonas sp. TaxID=306 RepID=UPI003A97C5C9